MDVVNDYDYEEEKTYLDESIRTKNRDELARMIQQNFQRYIFNPQVVNPWTYIKITKCIYQENLKSPYINFADLESPFQDNQVSRKQN